MESDSMKDKLKVHREKEIEFLQTLQGIVYHAKQELNNDLTRLAVKNMPMIMMDSSDQCQQVVEEVIVEEGGCSQSITSHNLQPVTDPSGVDIQELEPLDLDV